MMQGKSLAVLRAQGDVLERSIFDDDQTAAVFSHYPDLWAAFVLPNRKPDDKAHIAEGWAKFARGVYTALVRGASAFEASRSLQNECAMFIEDASGNRLLAIHSLLFSFYCNAGAAADNIQSAAVEKCTGIDFLGKRDEPGELGWFYDRRTQFIHKALVPAWNDDSTLFLDTSHFEDTEVEWPELDKNPEELAALVKSHAEAFCGCLNTAFAALRSYLGNTGMVGVLKPAITQDPNIKVTEYNEISSGRPNRS